MSKKNKSAKKSKQKNQDIETPRVELDFEGVDFESAEPENTELQPTSFSSTESDSAGFLDSLVESADLESAKFESMDQDTADREEESDAVNLSESEQTAWDELMTDAEDSLEEAFEELTSDEEALSFAMDEVTVSDEATAENAEEEDDDQPLSLTAEDGSAVEIVQITDDEAVSVIESLLFITDRPVGLTTFKNAFVGTNITTKKIKALISELQADLAQVRRGVILEEVDGAYQMRTKVDNQDYIKKIIKAKTFKLTGPSLETLAVIAYKQPCIKADVDEVRGVESGHLVRALMDKGLVAFAGKSELPGKPMFYKTTRKFLEIFGLRNTSELPTLKEMEELLPEGIGHEEEKETLSDLTGKLSENYGGNYSVAEDELGKITEQLAGISTNTEFFEDEKRKQKEKQERERAESLQEAIALGEEVEAKDIKWLEKYEAKLAAELENQEAEAKQALTADASLDEEGQSSDFQQQLGAKDEDQSGDLGEINAEEVQIGDFNEISAEVSTEEDFDIIEPKESEDPLDLL